MYPDIKHTKFQRNPAIISMIFEFLNLVPHDAL